MFMTIPLRRVAGKRLLQRQSHRWKCPWHHHSIENHNCNRNHNHNHNSVSRSVSSSISQQQQQQQQQHTLPVDEVTIDADGDVLQTELASIVRPYHQLRKPVVVRGVVKNTPATKLWSSWDYWQKTVVDVDVDVDADVDADADGGDTPVSVEIGGAYGSEGSQRAEIPFSAYLRFLRLFEEKHGRTGSLPLKASGDNNNTGSGGVGVVEGDNDNDDNDDDDDDDDGAPLPSIPPSGELVYMAQNDLLAPLYKDVMIPDFCKNGDDGGHNSCRDNDDDCDDDDDDDDTAAVSGTTTTTTTTTTTMVGHGRLYSVMMWVGPRGCVSPLHYDPLDNCFLQHVGRKRVLLFEPGNSNSGGGGSKNNNTDDDLAAASAASCYWHYAGHHGQQSNTSPIDPEVLDDIKDHHHHHHHHQQQQQPPSKRLRDHMAEYPLFFEEAPPRWECLLEPGDFLYIPSKWWHHVRSIDTSASVNVWWR